ncbi:MAG: hypothetical protein QM764_09390 [Chitinophagaceae bacterium]
MQDKILTVIKSDLNKLGVYQLAGGIVGLILVFLILSRQIVLNAANLILYFFVVLLFGYSIYTGICCLKRKQNALILSKVNQFLQLIGIAVAGFAFQFASGFYLTFGVDLTESFRFDFGAGIANFILRLNSANKIFSVNVNLVAIGIIIWIDGLLKTVKQLKELDTISTIGKE